MPLSKAFNLQRLLQVHHSSRQDGGRAATNLLSLSRLRMSSLKVSLFFSSIPLTSYTTCDRPQGGVREFYTSKGRRREFNVVWFVFLMEIGKKQTNTRESRVVNRCFRSYLPCIVPHSKVVHSNTWFHIERVFLREEKGNGHICSPSCSWIPTAELIEWSEINRRDVKNGRTECWLCSFSSRVSSVALGKWLSSFSSARRPSFYGNMEKWHHLQLILTVSRYHQRGLISSKYVFTS